MLIEKNIKIESVEKQGLTTDCKEMLSKMEVNDSVLIPADKRLSYRSTLDRLVRLSNSDVKFIFRRVDDNNYRCWRII